MKRLIRFCRGWVEFGVTGGFPERFINLCAAHGFALWGMRRCRENFVFCTWAGAYPKLRRCARGAGVKMRIKKRRGLPFLLYRHRRRWGFAAGAVLCVGVLAASSLFLWRIEVVGNQRLEEQVVLQALQEVGVKPGMALSAIDVRSVERRLMMQLDDLGWVAVNLQGSTAVVQVQERTLPPPILDRRQPCNVVAAHGGQITEMKVYVGQKMAAVGDAVAAGDILVSGVVEDAAHDMHLVAARADIMAKTRHTLQVEVPLERKVYHVQQVLRRYSLKIGSLEIPLWVGKPPKGQFRLERMYTPLTLMGKKLPLWLGKRQYLLLQQQEETLTHQQAAHEAQQRLKKLEKNLPGTVLECQEELQNLPQGVALCADYTLLENIARQTEIFTHEPQE